MNLRGDMNMAKKSLEDNDKPSVPKVSSLVSLPQSVQNLSTDQLHLNSRTHGILARAGITTIGELIDAYSSSLNGMSGIGARSRQAVQDALAALSHSLREDKQVDWLRYWRIQEIRLIPKEYETDASTGEVIGELPTIIKEVLSQYKDERLWIVVQRRYTLEGTEKLTLQELGDAFGIERERVRQLETKALAELSAALIQRQYQGKDYHVYPGILSKIQALCNTVASETTEAILENTMLDRIREAFDIEPESVKPSLFLLFFLAGIERVEFDNPNLISVWGYLDAEQRRILKHGIDRIDRLLTKEISLPLACFPHLKN
jgi:hypothetical protein